MSSLEINGNFKKLFCVNSYSISRQSSEYAPKVLCLFVYICVPKMYIRCVSHCILFYSFGVNFKYFDGISMKSNNISTEPEPGLG